MKLSVLDRLLLLGGLLPEKGSIITLRIVRDLQHEIGFTEDEHRKLAFVTLEGGGMRWNVLAEAECEREIELKPVATKVIVESLQALEKKGQLHKDHMSLYERFVEGKEPDK